MCNSLLSRSSCDVFAIDISCSKGPLECASPLNEGSYNPLLVPLDGGKILAIPDSAYRFSAHPVFEIYDPLGEILSTDLKYSPSLTKDVPSEMGDFISVLVFDNKIHVSTTLGAFCFNPSDCMLCPSYLFGNSSLPLQTDECDRPDILTVVSGEPFCILGLGLLLLDGKVLVGTTRSFELVAFLIKDGKVVDVQVLEPEPKIASCFCSYLVDLGYGYFCALSTVGSSGKGTLDILGVNVYVYRIRLLEETERKVKRIHTFYSTMAMRGLGSNMNFLVAETVKSFRFIPGYPNPLANLEEDAYIVPRIIGCFLVDKIMSRT